MPGSSNGLPDLRSEEKDASDRSDGSRPSIFDGVRLGSLTEEDKKRLASMPFGPRMSFEDLQRSPAELEKIRKEQEMKRSRIEALQLKEMQEFMKVLEVSMEKTQNFLDMYDKPDSARPHRIGIDTSMISNFVERKIKSRVRRVLKRMNKAASDVKVAVTSSKKTDKESKKPVDLPSDSADKKSSEAVIENDASPKEDETDSGEDDVKPIDTKSMTPTSTSSKKH